MSRPDWILDQTVRAQLTSVEELLGQAARCGEIPDLHAQLVSSRAKRLRPALLLLASRFGPIDPGELLIKAATGIEMLHEATLYHDDIVDEAETRRGLPSTHRRHGAYAASCGGSELLYRTVALFADLPSDLRRHAASTVNAICTGQLREIEGTGTTATSIPQRIKTMRQKTGRLFALATTIGSRLAGSDTAVVGALGSFGETFGLSFQLADDLRDLLESQAGLGRLPGADLLDGVYTLPVLLALRQPREAVVVLRRQLERVVHTRSREDFAVCVALLRASGGIRRAIEIQNGWIRSARGELAGIPGGPVDTLASLGQLVDGLSVYDPSSDGKGRSSLADGQLSRDVINA